MAKNILIIRQKCKELITIRNHINNVFKDEELDKNNNTLKMHIDGAKQLILFYNFWI